MSQIATKVEVSFYHPQTGPVKEQYDLKNPYDVLCWKANNKLTALVQTSVKTLEQEPSSIAMFKVQEAREKANEMFTELKKGQNN